MCSSNSYRVQAACALGLVAELFTLGVLEPPSSPPIFFQAFSLRHHPTLFVREIETNNLLAVKHSIPRRSFILSCCLQVQSRRKGVVSSGRSGLAVLSWRRASWLRDHERPLPSEFWLHFAKCFVVSFGLLNKSMWSYYSSIRFSVWRFQQRVD
jgi:hypothetical protein